MTRVACPTPLTQFLTHFQSSPLMFHGGPSAFSATAGATAANSTSTAAAASRARLRVPVIPRSVHRSRALFTRLCSATPADHRDRPAAVLACPDARQLEPDGPR